MHDALGGPLLRVCHSPPDYGSAARGAAQGSGGNNIEGGVGGIIARGCGGAEMMQGGGAVAAADMVEGAMQCRDSAGAGGIGWGVRQGGSMKVGQKDNLVSGKASRRGAV